jgi:hypothetical protein
LKPFSKPNTITKNPPHYTYDTLTAAKKTDSILPKKRRGVLVQEEMMLVVIRS